MEEVHLLNAFANEKGEPAKCLHFVFHLENSSKPATKQESRKLTNILYVKSFKTFSLNKCFRQNHIF